MAPRRRIELEPMGVRSGKVLLRGVDGTAGSTTFELEQVPPSQRLQEVVSGCLDIPLVRSYVRSS
jgi:hypothetical protein